MAVREQVGTWAARPGYRVLLRQDGPLGRPLLWVPLVPGGPRVNEASEQALTYSNLTVNTGIAGNGGGFYDFNGTNSAVTFTNPRDPLTPTSTLAASTPVTLTWLQRYDTQSNSYPFVWSIYFNSITSFVCFQAPSDGTYYFVAGVAGSNTPSFSSGHGAPVVGRVNRYVLTAANGLGATSGFVMWRDGVRFTSPGTAATSDGLTGSSKIGGRSSDSAFNWSGVIADAGIFAGIPSDAAIRQFFDRPYDGLYQPQRIVVPVGSGLTAVTSDFTASYSVIASLTKDFTASYTVIAAVEQSLAASYNVQAAVQKDLAASYSVVASVSSDLAAAYNVIAAVSKDLAAAYNVQVAVSKDLAAAYSVIAPVVSDFAASYSVIAAVTKDLAASYNVIASAAKDLAASYNVIASVEQSLAASYDILGDSTVVADFIGAYNIVGAVQKDLAASYSVFESAQQDLAASYTVFQAVQQDLAANYTVFQAVQQDLPASYTVFKAVQQDLAASYTVVAAVVQNLVAAYDIESTGGGTGATAEQIATAVWAKIGEDGLPYGDIVRVFLAALAGRTTGVGTSTESYLSADGSKPRLTVTFDSNNNRVAVTLDGTP